MTVVYTLKMLYKFAFVLLMSPHIAFLDAAAVAGKPEDSGRNKIAKQVHRNEAPTSGSQLDHSERIVASRTNEIGAEKTSKL